MPADSDLVTLPHTWRPMGTRFAITIGCAGLFIVCLGGYYGLPADERSAIFKPLDLWLFGACGVGVLVIWWALFRCRLTASRDGVVVVNGLRRREYAWAQLVSITMPHGAPWATLDIADGTSVAVTGIQASDGRRAQDAVEQVRALLERRAPSGG